MSRLPVYGYNMYPDSYNTIFEFKIIIKDLSLHLDDHINRMWNMSINLKSQCKR